MLAPKHPTQGPRPARRALLWVAPAVAAGIALALVGAIALASIPDASGVIHGCYRKATGALRVIDSASSQCGSLEQPLNWNQRGPSDAYVATGAGGTLPTDGSFDTLVSVHVPSAGGYLITAEVFLGNRNSVDELVRCFLTANGGILENVVPEADLLPVPSGRVRYSFQLSLNRDAILPAGGGDIDLTCGGGSLAATDQPLEAFDPYISALQVGQVHS